MALTLDQVRKIAALARLRLEPAEEQRFAAQLGKVVDSIDELQKYEAGGGGGGSPEPLVAPGHEAEDVARPGLPHELFLANAPAALGPFLLVPEIKGGGDAG
jgi:aspartyl-tRNA(Asn)/glutamyl-tRNA(Gln) amidotransferase subunit C